MLELVRGYTTAALDAARRSSTLDAVVADLRSISRLLVTSEHLRLVLTDNSIPRATRAAVLEDLLGSEVVPEALGPVLFSVHSERAVEITKTVEQLVGEAELAKVVADAGEPLGAETPIGRLGSYERIRGYADRVFEGLGGPSDVDAVEDELFRLARIAETTPSLREVVADSTVPVSGRLAVLEDLLRGKARTETSLLAGYAVRAGRSRDFVGALDYLVELAAAERGRRVANVRSAVELTDSESDRLAQALGRLMRRPVQLRVRLDPGTLGGLSVSIGDIVIDGTVRHRLEQLRESFAQRA